MLLPKVSGLGSRMSGVGMCLGMGLGRVGYTFWGVPRVGSRMLHLGRDGV
jgi:hypothetical protein